MIEPKFVNREDELKALTKLAHQGSPSIFYIYGPEGCGKTRLLKEFIQRFDGIGIYIDALEEEKVDKALIFSPIPKETKNLITSIFQQFAGPIGRYLSRRLWTILDKIAIEVKIQNRDLVIAIDDVTRAIGLNEIERYIKWLYELRSKIIEEYKPKSVLIIATTSEGYSLNRILRHTYNVTNLIWNLNREAHEELISQLNPPNQKVIDKVWELTAGNPRCTIEIAHLYNWNIDNWLHKLKQNLRDLANLLKTQNLTKEVLQLIDEPDILDKEPTQKLRKAYEILLQQNLMIYTGITLLSSWVEKDASKKSIQPMPDLGIGKYYAWQIPAYRIVLKELLK